MTYLSKSSRFYALLLHLLLLLTLFVSLAAAQDDQLNDMFSDIPTEKHDEQDDEAQVTGLHSDAVDLLVDHKKKKFPGWGPLQREIKDVCVAMEVDGRNVQFKQIVDPYIVRENSCPACYQLMKIFSNSCQERKIKKTRGKKKKGEEAEETPTPEPTATVAAEPQPTIDPSITPTPTPVPTRKVDHQRELSMLTRLRIQILLEKLLRDARRLPDGRQAIKRLSKAIKTAGPYQAFGARDYFDAIREILEEFLSISAPQGESEEAGLGFDAPGEVHISNGEKENVDQLFDYD